MSYTYSEWLTAVANLLVIDPTDADFLAYAPRAIEYAEQRMYRELDLLATFTSSDAGSTVAGTRTFALPADTIVTNTVSIITPAATLPDAGARNVLIPATRDFLDMVYGNSSASLRGTPVYFAMLTNATIAFGPWPDAAYHVEVSRTYRPTPLSSSNQTTILTTYVPDVFLACSMQSWMQYQRDGTQASDAPGDAINWAVLYKEQMASAVVEAFRQKQLGVSATSKSTSPALNTQRG